MSVVRSRLAPLLLVCASCSLAEPPSHFFDPGGIETIAVANDLRLPTVVGTSVYFMDGATLFRVPTEGPQVTPTQIGRPGEWTIERLASNGDDLLAWCSESATDPMASTAWLVHGDAPPAELPLSSGCAFVSASTDAVTVARAMDTSGAAEVDHFVVSSSVYDVVVPLTPPSSALNGKTASDRTQWVFSELAASPGEDGTLWIFDERGLRHTCSGASCACFVTGGFSLDVKEFFAFGTNSSANVVIQSLNKLNSIPTSGGCCDPSNKASCEDGVKRGIAADTSVALVGEHLLTIRQGKVWLVTALKSQDSDVPIGVSAPAARGLGATARFAYYVDGAKLQRTPIRIP